MAERKTAEIKFRIEPSRKARFQQAAADEGIGLSEFIVNSCEDRTWAAANQKIDGTKLANNAIAALQCGCEWGDNDPLLCSAAGKCLGEIAAPSNNPFADIPSATTSDAAPTKCGDGAVQEGKWFSPEFKPWESR